MRCEQLVFEAGGNQVTLRLHPRLTVMGGMDARSARALIDDFIAALLDQRPGARAQLVSDSGEPLPPLRMMLVDAPDVAQLARLVEIGPIPPDVTHPRVAPLLQLAAVPPEELEAAADAVTGTAAHLHSLQQAADSTSADKASIEELGAQHGVYEDVRTAADERRRQGLLGSAALAVASFLAFTVAGPLLAVPLVLAAAALVFFTLRTHTRAAAAAAEEERRALEAAGADTGLGVQLKRVNLMLQTTRHSRDLAQAEEAHRQATAAWAALAGPVDPTRLRDHGDEIAMLRQLLADDERSAPAVASVLLALLVRIEAARVGPTPAHRLPAMLVGALDGLPPAAAVAFLEMLLRRPAAGQVILLTRSEDLLAWARGVSGDRLRLVGPRPATV